MSVCDRICSCGATNRWVLNPICVATIASSCKSKAAAAAPCEHFQWQRIKKHRKNATAAAPRELTLINVAMVSL